MNKYKQMLIVAIIAVETFCIFALSAVIIKKNLDIKELMEINNSLIETNENILNAFDAAQ